MDFLEGVQNVLFSDGTFWKIVIGTNKGYLNTFLRRALELSYARRLRYSPPKNPLFRPNA